MKQIITCTLLFAFCIYCIDCLSPIFGCLSLTVCLLFICWHISTFIIEYMVNIATVSSQGKAVLITGCDSGFGHRIALKLNQLGYQVFAGCLFPDGNGAKILSENRDNELHVIKLDVTDDEDVDKALLYVKKHLRNNKLWAVINNAGIVHYSMFEFGAPGIKLFEDMINVNTLGCVRVTKTFLPILRNVRKSRIVIVSSIAGEVDIPYLSAYCMSKFAVRSFANAMRRELKSFDVFVSIVEPSVYNTAMGDENAILNGFENICNQTPQHIRDDYGNEQRKGANIVRALIETKLRNTDDVVNAMVDAVSKKIPRPVYTLGSVFTRTFIYMHTMLALEVSDFLFTYYPSLLLYKMTAVIHRLLKL